jgi:hypothetical protein
MAAQLNLLDQQRLTRAAIFGALVGEMDLVGADEFGDGLQDGAVLGVDLVRNDDDASFVTRRSEAR